MWVAVSRSGTRSSKEIQRSSELFMELGHLGAATGDNVVAVIDFQRKFTTTSSGRRKSAEEEKVPVDGKMSTTRCCCAHRCIMALRRNWQTCNFRFISIGVTICSKLRNTRGRERKRFKRWIIRKGPVPHHQESTSRRDGGRNEGRQNISSRLYKRTKGERFSIKSTRKKFFFSPSPHPHSPSFNFKRESVGSN